MRSITRKRGRALGTRDRRSSRCRVALVILVASALSSGCIDWAKGRLRAQYDYRAARSICHAYRVDRQVCLDTVDEAYERGENPATYVSEKERKRLEQERRDEEERHQRILARCTSAPDLIRSAIVKRECAKAYTIAEESEGVCPNGASVTATLLSEVRQMSPDDVAACPSKDIARLYWRPIEIWDWMAAAGRGKLISTNGVYIPGRVEQQFDDRVVLEVNETTRVVLRLDRKRFFPTGTTAYVIGRFVEIGHFNTALGASIDIPVFDVVYWLG